MISHACRIILVNTFPSLLGVASPEGWLWATTIAIAPARMARWKIFRGCTTDLLAIPIEIVE